jgi:hypothetical protein
MLAVLQKHMLQSKFVDCEPLKYMKELFIFLSDFVTETLVLAKFYSFFANFWSERQNY